MMLAPAPENEFLRDVRAGLSGFGQKTLPCRYLYDAVGSALFEAITHLGEYGLTRADARILQAHAAEITGCLPGPLVVAELGSGTGMKTRPVLESLRQRQVSYFPIDVSPSALAQCARELDGVSEVIPIEKSYLEGMSEVAAGRRAGEKLMVLFLGSTIGNFEPDAAVEFLTALRSWMCPGDGLLLGTDLVKPMDRLLAAYDDAAGVTAAFNLNLLARINRELDGDFPLDAFEHVARFNPDARSIEMHLRAKRDITAHVHAAQLTVSLKEGETIWTESSHKYRAEEMGAIADDAGFVCSHQWIEKEWGFAESLLLAK